jgi:predicted NBD/HSP70 family sugar kinase
MSILWSAITAVVGSFDCISQGISAIKRLSQYNQATTGRIVMYVAIDVGSAAIRVAVFKSQFPHDDQDRPLPSESRELAVTNNFGDDMRAILAASDELTAGSVVQAVGMAVAGRLDAESKRTIDYSRYLEGWQGQDIGLELLQHYSCPYYLLGDVQAAGIGEAVYGLKPHEDFWFVVWDTGIGGALVRRLGIPRRPEAYASELGHQSVEPAGLECSCGQYGCLETYVGGANIEPRFNKPIDQLDAEDWELVLETLGEGVRNLVMVQPTALIVFAGEVARAQQESDGRIDQLHAVVENLLNILPAPRFELSVLGMDGGIYGALALASR